MPSNWAAHSPGTFSFLRGFSPTGRIRRLTLGSLRRRRMRLVSSQTSSPEICTLIGRSLAVFCRTDSAAGGLLQTSQA